MGTVGARDVGERLPAWRLVLRSMGGVLGAQGCARRNGVHPERRTGPPAPFAAAWGGVLGAQGCACRNGVHPERRRPPPAATNAPAPAVGQALGARRTMRAAAL